MSKELGISVKKSEDFAEWYTQVVLKAELAEYGPVKGSMILRPYGYAIWERIRAYFDQLIQRSGHQNAYFPTLIPESYLRKEQEHLAGFTPEVYWVTHSGDSLLGERLAVRPTSETIVSPTYAKWIRSWRDLPLLLNFWNSFYRSEVKMPKPFIRTTEILWQEGHTVHATEEDALREVFLIADYYRDVMENLLAIPVRVGTKTAKERFAGAVMSVTFEALMPDGKVLQMGTSHHLGQNFTRVFDIKYLGKDEQMHFAWSTSWGISWRLIGAVAMVHGDDRGLILPPLVAPIQVIIIPIYYRETDTAAVRGRAREVAHRLDQAGIRVHVDDRDEYTPGWKFNEWELKGVPLRLEIGSRELRDQVVTAVNRLNGTKTTVSMNELGESVAAMLERTQQTLRQQAQAFLDANTHTVEDYARFKARVEGPGGFVRAAWCGESTCEAALKEETGADIRLLPLTVEPVTGSCVRCNKPGQKMAYFARAY